MDSWQVESRIYTDGMVSHKSAFPVLQTVHIYPQNDRSVARRVKSRTSMMEVAGVKLVTALSSTVCRASLSRLSISMVFPGRLHVGWNPGVRVRGQGGGELMLHGFKTIALSSEPRRSNGILVGGLLKSMTTRKER